MSKWNATFMPSLTEKLVSAVAGGNPPDIATIDESYGVPKMARAGGLLSLQEYFAKDGVKQEDFIPFTWETVLFKGVPYGIPGGAGANVLFYDKAVWRMRALTRLRCPIRPSGTSSSSGTRS